ncbi:sigma-E factor negative regulatory protein [Methylomagnum ishizawai]|uniref:sigma-E factor negative regulatory protein n=1 Tax=Methylomagnum ishizawai TaxID=1760988 RepID=UPI001C324816|nr:sigma-E factor negative regulatory protein [Methylomagnum ishizawai]BBL76056.1 hypothetical protein MishRS11D_31540 [Methylomagnum ishizawai]
MIEDSLKQKLSLMLDDELGRDESLKLLAGIESDPALRAQWRRYNLVGMALRSQSSLVPDSGFVDRISAALADEPTILAPQAAKSATRRDMGYRDKVVTLALAASLAAVAVMVGKSLHDYSPMNGPNVIAQSGIDGDNAQASVDPEFRDYLVAHYETAYLSGAQGMLPSVRLVSSGSPR